MCIYLIIYELLQNPNSPHNFDTCTLTLWPDNSKKKQTKKPKQNEGIKKDANKNLEINITVKLAIT